MTAGMKALLLSVLLLVGLDEAFDGGRVVGVCIGAVRSLVVGTQRDVGESVFSQ